MASPANNAAPPAFTRSSLTKTLLALLALLVVILGGAAFLHRNTLTIVNASGQPIDLITIRVGDHLLLSRPLASREQIAAVVSITSDSEYVVDVKFRNHDPIHTRVGYLTQYIPNHSVLEIGDGTLSYNGHVVEQKSQ